MRFVVKKRCTRCRHVLRDDGTCQNENCCLYEPEKVKENTAEINTDAGPDTSSNTENND